MPNYRRHYVPGHAVFVTLVTFERRPWLTEPDNRETLLSAMHRAKARHSFDHVAHVILPDHLHWMFIPGKQANFSVIVAAVKRDVTWRMKEKGEADSPLWQNRFYDHVIRDENDFARHLDYIHFNPVRHGVAVSPGSYAWSSFSSWCEKGVYPLDWGETGNIPESIRDMNLE